MIPDDVKYLLPRGAFYRLIIKPELELENVNAREIVDELLSQVRVPV